MTNIDFIIGAVESASGVDPGSITGPRRTRSVAYARFAAVWLIRRNRMTNNDQSNHAAASPTNSEAVRSGDWLDDAAGCPECGKPLKPKKSWGGLMACYCRWGGRRPSVNQIVASADAYEREQAAARASSSAKLSHEEGGKDL